MAKDPQNIVESGAGELGNQPFQLELFRLTDVPYTNAFEFYEAIPRFLVGGDKARYIKPDGSFGSIQRNADGTALPIEKIYEYKEKSYTLEIAPATLKQKGKYRAIFPGVREEIIEFIIFKLAIEQGYFYDGVDGNNRKTDSYTVITSVYEIRQELKKRHGTTHGSYNHSQIIEALTTLQKTNFTIRGATKEDSYNFSPIVEFGHMNTGNGKDSTGKSTKLYIKLNSLVAKAILAKSWRQIAYNDIMQDESYLGRWFRKTLGLRFSYAELGRNYNIKLSTVINHSGISPYKEFRDNLKYVKRTLKELDIVGHIRVEQETRVNPKTGRKVMVDALLKIYPSKDFVSQVIRANAHTKRLEGAMQGEGGLPLLEPRRSDFKTPQEYEKARRDYLQAQAQ
ncbi:MAG: hypothetical protein GY746_08860 [Gammaproteobacteria bacterium]|nr:hypothetical protein [Gammaproteobacteria bacterium]